MSFARYHEAVDYLQRRLWHELPIVPVERALQGRVRTLLAHFDDPQTRFPVVHVGGSAGKGSTATIAASILRQAMRTGLYTSPHLQTFMERIRVDDALIAPDAFADIVLGLDPLVRKMHLDVLDGVGFGRPSLVEVAFAAGMKHFGDERIEAAVVEVGLGGRTDYSNIFDLPHAAATVLTNVDFEHTERLGGTIAAIAREKSAIVHGGTVVTAARRREAIDVIERRCGGTGARLWRYGRDVRARIVSAGPDGSVFDLRTPIASYRELHLPLAGAHQVTNASLAVAAALAAAEANGWAIGEEQVRAGLAWVRMSCRLEAVQREPLVLLDGAHNPLEAKRLAEALRAHWLAPHAELHLVVGILADKDQAAMVREFVRVAKSVFVTQPPLGERTGDPDRMLALFGRALGPRNVSFEPSPERALDEAMDRAGRRGIVCATGSMFLVGALRERWVPELRILETRSAALQAR